MSDFNQQIQQARQAGYSDSEIAGFLSQKHPDLAPKIQEATKAGYQPGEILDHLSPPKAPYKSSLPWPLSKLDETVNDSVDHMAEGVMKIIHGSSADERLGGASQILHGFANSAGVPLVMQAGVAAPLRTALGLGVGTVAQKGVSGAAGMMGAGPGTSQFAGDVAGVLAGGAASTEGGSRLLRNTASAVKSGVGNAVDTAVDLAKSPVARDVLGVVSPRAAHAANVLNRGMNAAEKIKAAIDARNAPGPPTVDLPQGFSVAQGTTGSPAAARPTMGPQPAPVVPAAGGALPGQFIPEPPALPPGFGVGGGATSGPLPAAMPAAAPGYVPPVSGELPRPPLASMTREQIGKMTRAEIVAASQIPAPAPAAPVAPAPAVPVQAAPVAAPVALPADAMPPAATEMPAAPPPARTLAQTEAAMAQKAPPPTEAAGRSGFNPDGSPKSPQMRAMERINTNTGNKAQRWADIFRGQGMSADDVGNMTTADLETVTAELRRKGAIGPKESAPKTSLDQVKALLKKSPPEKAQPMVEPSTGTTPAPEASTDSVFQKNVDLLAGKVKHGTSELTLDLSGSSSHATDSLIDAFKQRGLDASFDGRHLLVRAPGGSAPAPVAAPEIEGIGAHLTPKQRAIALQLKAAMEESEAVRQ